MSTTMIRSQQKDYFNSNIKHAPDEYNNEVMVQLRQGQSEPNLGFKFKSYGFYCLMEYNFPLRCLHTIL